MESHWPGWLAGPPCAQEGHTLIVCIWEPLGGVHAPQTEEINSRGDTVSHGKTKYMTRSTGNPLQHLFYLTWQKHLIPMTRSCNAAFSCNLQHYLFSLTSATPSQASWQDIPDPIYALYRIVSGHPWLALISSWRKSIESHTILPFTKFQLLIPWLRLPGHPLPQRPHPHPQGCWLSCG